MKQLLKKIWLGVKERGWDKIPDVAKHFMGSLFLVLIFYGIPVQWFGWDWSQTIQLFMAAVMAWGIGIVWELTGNMSHKDVFIDLAGVIAGVLFCTGVW